MSTPAPFIDLLRDRRSFRRFTRQKLSRQLVAQLQEALLRAPTSRGKNPWTFLFVEDRTQLESLSRAKAHGSGFLADAALAVVVCADETVSDVWVEDCAIAAITLQYAAHELKLGSCWAQIRNRPHDDQISAEAYIKTLLDLEEQLRVLCVIGIGYPDEQKVGHPFAALPTDKIRMVRT